jgi:hypothetical protein
MKKLAIEGCLGPAGCADLGCSGGRPGHERFCAGMIAQDGTNAKPMARHDEVPGGRRRRPKGLNLDHCVEHLGRSRLDELTSPD